MSENSTIVIKAKPPRRVYRARSKIPSAISENPKLLEAIESNLPANYNFEVPKTIWRIQEEHVKTVGLQMPEGLLMFATALADIIRTFTEDVDVIIMGDVTYGACCVDDFTARALGVELLIHYGHSCLIPIDQTNANIKMLYIFVDIQIDCAHFIDTIQTNFVPKGQRISLISTIQFVMTLQKVTEELRQLGYDITIPQARPLSPGEVLGCTAPSIPNTDVLIYLGDGRFHLEGAMIANPHLETYRYDPYEKRFTREYFDHAKMLSDRQLSIRASENVEKFGIILGTLGRQGNTKITDSIKAKINRQSVVILLSEIAPKKLELFNASGIGAYVQIACPRLSIDWGSTAFSRPLLTSYELSVVLKMSTWTNDKYPMDYYANSSWGQWTPNYKSCDKTNAQCCGKC